MPFGRNRFLRTAFCVERACVGDYCETGDGVGSELSARSHLSLELVFCCMWRTATVLYLFVRLGLLFCRHEKHGVADAMPTRKMVRHERGERQVPRAPSASGVSAWSDADGQCAGAGRRARSAHAARGSATWQSGCLGAPPSPTCPCALCRHYVHVLGGFWFCLRMPRRKLYVAKSAEAHSTRVLSVRVNISPRAVEP